MYFFTCYQFITFKTITPKHCKTKHHLKTFSLPNIFKAVTANFIVQSNFSSILIMIRAESAFKNKSFVEALALYSEVHGKEPENVDCLLKRSECFEELDEINLAMNDIFTAMKIDSMQPKLHKRLIALNLRLDKIDEVEILPSKSKKLFPGDKIDEKIQEKSQKIALRSYDSCENKSFGESTNATSEVAENPLKMNDQVEMKLKNAEEGTIIF